MSFFEFTGTENYHRRMRTFTPTKRTTLKRLPTRANYERETIYRILDEGFVCHVGFIFDDHPVVVPTAYGRSADVLYIHGSAASRMLRELADGIQMCITVTLVDGLVLARSAFHHSMNYRSVVVFGTASVVRNAKEKTRALRTFSEHVVPGRWSEVRKPSRKELKQTLVLRVPLKEASAKVRNGPPIDDEADYELRVWAGELPLRLTTDAPISDPRLKHSVEVPLYAQNYSVQNRSSQGS
jgi:nitroimidazol reductase NimA-like FMN-containing flavoprotein (pyridoxamine 5'-phosphate oxidase superfamily)